MILYSISAVVSARAKGQGACFVKGFVRYTSSNVKHRPKVPDKTLISFLSFMKYIYLVLIGRGNLGTFSCTPITIIRSRHGVPVQ